MLTSRMYGSVTLDADFPSGKGRNCECSVSFKLSKGYIASLACKRSAGVTAREKPYLRACQGVVDLQAQVCTHSFAIDLAVSGCEPVIKTVCFLTSSVHPRMGVCDRMTRSRITSSSGDKPSRFVREATLASSCAPPPLVRNT